ncbi:MAG: CvpA family protein [Fusobacteria bacterium]|nr:CvpA family protein [Fusobacteriota bacterium]
MSLDLILTLIIILFAAIGFFRGFIAEFFSIFGFLIAVLLSKYLTPHVIKFVHIESSHTTLTVLLYVVIFLILYFLLALCAKFLRVIIKIALLGWLDRVLGGVLGLIKGALLVVFIILVLMALSTSNNSCQKLTQNSFYVKVLLPRVVITSKFLPKSIAANVSQYRNQIALNGLINGLEKMYNNITTTNE